MAEEPSPELEQRESNAQGEVPESWLGYSWYLVKKAGYGSYSGEFYCCVLRQWIARLLLLFSGPLSRRKAGPHIRSDQPRLAVCH